MLILSLRSTDCLAPIIAMTANAFTEDRQVALDAGMNDHIAKPINMNVLVPTLRKYLRCGQKAVAHKNDQ